MLHSYVVVIIYISFTYWDSRVSYQYTVWFSIYSTLGIFVKYRDSFGGYRKSFLEDQ